LNYIQYSIIRIISNVNNWVSTTCVIKLAIDVCHWWHKDKRSVHQKNWWFKRNGAF